MPFETRIPVRFHHADIAGVMFYGNLLFFAHEVFEEFVVAAGFAWSEWFENPGWLVPFRHVEADYFKPKRPGRELVGKLWLERIGRTSLTVRVRFFDPAGDLASELRMVVVFTDKRAERTLSIPPEVRARLEPFLETVPPIEAGCG